MNRSVYNFFKNNKFISINQIDHLLTSSKYNNQYKFKGNVLELFAKHYYQMQGHVCYLFNEIPDSIRSEQKIGNIDKGIDLIVKMNKTWYAVQCKWRSKIDKPIDKNSISGFFVEYQKTKIKKGILFTNVIHQTNYWKNDLLWVTRNDLTDSIVQQTINDILNPIIPKKSSYCFIL